MTHSVQGAGSSLSMLCTRAGAVPHLWSITSISGPTLLNPASELSPGGFLTGGRVVG